MMCALTSSDRGQLWREGQRVKGIALVISMRSRGANQTRQSRTSTQSGSRALTRCVTVCVASAVSSDKQKEFFQQPSTKRTLNNSSGVPMCGAQATYTTGTNICTSAPAPNKHCTEPEKI
uniref:Uncharacterized protein n=1 Tax=Anopheles atroparvus TaxID=41427 RepID=A0AAG5D132_ANOAO